MPVYPGALGVHRRLNEVFQQADGTSSPNKKAPGRNLPSGSVAILPLQIDGKKTLAAAAGAAAIAALVAASVARHDGAALRTQRRMHGHGGVERQFLLRAGFGGT